MEKKGLIKLGMILKLKPDSKGENCFTSLSKRVGRTIRQFDVDEFIESSEFHREFIDEEGNPANEADALSFRFRLPWNDSTTGQPL